MSKPVLINCPECTALWEPTRAEQQQQEVRCPACRESDETPLTTAGLRTWQLQQDIRESALNSLAESLDRRAAEIRKPEAELAELRRRTDAERARVIRLQDRAVHDACRAMRLWRGARWAGLFGHGLLLTGALYTGYFAWQDLCGGRYGVLASLLALGMTATVCGWPERRQRKDGT